MLICLKAEVSVSSSGYQLAQIVAGKHRNFIFYNPDFHFFTWFWTCKIFQRNTDLLNITESQKNWACKAPLEII